MAWRPHDNLIDGELDNRVPGKVTGWMRFFRDQEEPLRVTFDLEGDFHEDIRGKVIRLSAPAPSDRNAELGRDGTYMEGFSPLQQGTVGDITAGLPLGKWDEALSAKIMAQHELAWAANKLPEPEKERLRRKIAEEHRARIAAGEPYFAYAAYPYLEWYSEGNGRVVLELEPSQVVIDHKGSAPLREKAPEELFTDQLKRSAAFVGFMSDMVEEFSEINQEKGGDGNVTGLVI